MADLDLDVTARVPDDGVVHAVRPRRPPRRAARRAARGRRRPRASFRRADRRRTTEYDAWREFYADVADLAARRRPDADSRRSRTSASCATPSTPASGTTSSTDPLGAAIERRFADDTVRGVVATDALIGTFASLHDPSLIQNRCFLYHLIGNGTGEWRVPVGGMGAVTDALARGRHRRRRRDRHRCRRQPRSGRRRRRRGQLARRHRPRARVTARRVLSDVAPVGAADPARRGRGPRHQARGRPAQDQLAARPAAAAAVRRRPGRRLRRHPAPRRGLQPARGGVRRGGRRPVPDDDAGRGLLPLADRPLDPRRRWPAPARTRSPTSGCTPRPRSSRPTREGAKRLAVERAIASLDEHLVEPIESCLARDADGDPCIEAKIPQDVERDLAMPGGHIFHGDLDWPWAPNRARLRHPGAAVGRRRPTTTSVLLCGSGARRGGAVSGLGGHNAAQAVLADLG